MRTCAYWFLIIGGLNWLLVGVFQNDLGSWILGGTDTLISRAVYLVVGLSAVYLLIKGGCNKCESKVEKTSNSQTTEMPTSENTEI